MGLLAYMEKGDECPHSGAMVILLLQVALDWTVRQQFYSHSPGSKCL